ncbi:MAG: PQQ-dependent dehydrogenase, methanol/ethanol family [Acidobacteria bacterium]|nr:PQQ-dependent dehydrogenase, methanol/ethanol family [Acidobacteriota bacterium]
MIRLAALLLALASAAAQVSPQALAQAQNDDASWLHYGRNYSGWRYSALDQIHRGNVAKLAPAWIYQTGVSGRGQATPLVHDGVMYVTGQNNTAVALDLRTGKPIWTYSKRAPAGAQGCCGQPNRGFAILGDKLFKVNFEGTLVALDAKTGRTVWETELADYRQGYSATNAPLVVGNLVVTGIAGGEFGTRDFIDAYDADTGERVWRFWTVPAPGEPGGETWGAGHAWKRGGGSTWITGTYDPELNLIYWGTGNPGPDMNGDVRPGDNLYTCSIVALDAATGELRWHFQFTPHDTHDWDAVADPVLADLEIGGAKVKALLQANRNGFFYVLDRTTGEFLHATPYTEINWASGIDSAGKPVLIEGREPTPEGNVACPGLGGGHNWQATAYSPQTRLYYFQTTDGCHIFYATEQGYIEGQWYQASTFGRVAGKPDTGAILGVDPVDGKIRWRFPLVSPPSAGILATAGKLVFSADPEGYFFALDAETGEPLWRFQTGDRVAAPPITYTLDGEQRIALVAGVAVMTFKLVE